MIRFPAALWMMCGLSLIAGCATTTGPASCDGFKPIRPQAGDVGAVSPDLARQIVAHNRFGEARCRWRAA
jgi:hypothetical protein